MRNSKSRDSELIWESFVSETLHSPENSVHDDEDAEHYDKTGEIKKKEDVKEDKKKQVAESDEEEYDDLVAGDTPDKADGEGWTSEGLEELGPEELVEFIGHSLKKFLQKNKGADNESAYDVRKALYNAAYTINWEIGPDEEEEEEEETSWQDRAAKAGQKFRDSGGKMFDKSNAEYDAMDIDDPDHWQNSGAMPPGY